MNVADVKHTDRRGTGWQRIGDFGLTNAVQVALDKIAPDGATRGNPED